MQSKLPNYTKNTISSKRKLTKYLTTKQNGYAADSQQYVNVPILVSKCETRRKKLSHDQQLIMIPSEQYLSR